MSSLFHQSKQLQRVSAAECEAFDARRPRMRSLFHQSKQLQRVSAAECEAFDARMPRMSSLFLKNMRCIAPAMRAAQQPMRGGRV